MTSLERRLHEALVGEAERVRPAEDLFARVREGVQADRRRRRRRRRLPALVTAGAAAAVLIALAGGWRPAPQWLADDVFHDNPLTGKSYIVLSDIVYYHDRPSQRERIEEPDGSA